MKKYSLLAIAGIFAGSLAVSSAALDMSAGAKGGLGINTNSTSNLTYQGFVGGGVFDMMFNQVFGFEADLFYNMKGHRYSVFLTNIFVDETCTYKENYLDIPLLAKFTLPLKSPVKPMVFAGPSFGILLSSKEHIVATTSPLSSYLPFDSTIDLRAKTNSFDFCFVFGAGAEISAGPGKIVVDIRYSLGQTKVMTFADWKNSQLGLMAGYSFKL